MEASKHPFIINPHGATSKKLTFFNFEVISQHVPRRTEKNLEEAQ
jgi:hypothetical protein